MSFKNQYNEIVKFRQRGSVFQRSTRAAAVVYCPKKKMLKGEEAAISLQNEE